MLRSVIACIDVQYAGTAAQAAIVAFDAWESASPVARAIVQVQAVEPYEPGAFYRRELPCLRAALAALAALAAVPDIVIVDGHAWLAVGSPGLGARLLEAEPRLQTVVGVAKTRFRDTPAAEVLRGSSKAPLFVDEAGQFADAAPRVAAMHGRHRIPTMLKLVDRLARGLEPL
jgi:deoxyribonuclease V